MGDEQARPGVPQDKIDFPGSEPVIERHQNDVRQGGGEIGLQKDVAIVLQDGGAVAGLKPPVPKDPGQAENPSGKFLIRENTLVTANGRLEGIGPGCFEYYLG
jgi:hypothetical protein